MWEASMDRLPDVGSSARKGLEAGLVAIAVSLQLSS